jgi:hypothetical protein
VTRWALVLTAAAVLAVPACSSDDPSTVDTGGVAAAPAGGGAAIDACGLLSPAEVKAVLPGAPDQGQSEGDGRCLWEDPDTFDSLSVRIGGEDTARGGMPESPYGDAKPGPDGIRFGMGDTTAEFAVADRWCEVQLTKGTTDQLVSLVGTVKSRVGG